MPNSECVLFNDRKHLKIMNFYIILLSIISNLILIHSNSQFNEDFLNMYPNVINLLIFNHTKFNAGSKNKNGDLIMEYYSEENLYDIPTSLLFYGLSKNGRQCFSNESSYTQEKNIDIHEIIDISGSYNNYEIYDSKNLFVSIKNDYNKKNKYLFSINTYNSIIELHNLNNDADINHYLWDFSDFFNLDKGKYEFPYETSLYELKGESLYIIVFLPKIPLLNLNEDILNLSFMKKFTLESFSENAYKELNSVGFNNYINRIIIGTFFMDDCGILVSISFKISEMPSPEEDPSSERILTVSRGSQPNDFGNNQTVRYNLNFYNEYLQPKEIGHEMYMHLTNLFEIDTEYIYFKAIYLKKKYVMFSYISYNFLLFDLYKINLQYGGEMVYPENDENNKIQLPSYIFSNEFLSDFIKINDIKLVFICTYYNFQKEIVSRNLMQFMSQIAVFIIEINPDYSDYMINKGSSNFFNLGNIAATMHFSAFNYNGFLLFTSTAMSQEDIFNFDDETNYFSMLMIFGYPNGTDCTIDISALFENSEEEDINPYIFFEFLFENYTIENNIIGYEPVEMIKLVSIPEEIIVIERQNNEEIHQLKNNSFMYPDAIYEVKQNENLLKTSKYYYIDYQYMAQEGFNKRRLNYEEPKFYYGRTNRVKFKLCHDFCETCYLLSTSDGEQKCISCLSEYQYDYFYFTQKNSENQLLNCVPKDYFYYLGNLTPCDEGNTKHYTNTTNNKSICFSEEYPCPPSYPNYNETSKECFYCDFERFKNGECSADNLTMEVCTQCTYECFKIGGCNFNDFNNTKDDFYDRIKDGGYLSNYDGGADLKIKNGDGYAFQITTLGNELNNLKENKQRNFSIIDFKDCADLLRSQNNLESDEDLVILKYENDNQVSNGNEKSIQYEVYLPNSDTKLDLSVCNNTKINIYIPVELDKKTQKLYDSLKEQGYNLFDKNDKFYTDICTPYKSENGTDILLSDRFNEIFLKNELGCQANCEYSDYLPGSEYLKCECNVVNEEKIETNEQEKLTAKSTLKSFYNILKYFEP